MNFLDDWNKKNKQTQKKAGLQSASLPAAQKAELKTPLTLTKSGVVMADGKGGGKLITPTLGPKAAQTPLVKPMAARNAQRSGQLVNTGTMISDTGSNKRQAPLTLTKSGVVMADGKGGGKLITPTLGPKAAQTPIVKPMAARKAQRQLVNTGTMISDTGSNKRQVPAVTTPKGKAQRTVDDLPDIAAFGAGNYGADKKPLQGFLARAGKTVSGGAKGSLAGNMDAMGVAYQAGQGGRTQRNTEELRDAQWAVARAKYAYDTDRSPAAKSELDNALTKMRAFATVLGDGAYEQALDAAYDAAARFGTADLNELYNSLGNVQPAQGTGVQQRAGETARDLAADVQESANRDIEAAKTGVSKFWQNAIDAGASMTQSGIDAAASAILGLRPTRLNGGYALMGNVVEKRLPGAMIPFATRAFGGAAMEAREGGGDLAEQIAYGAGIGSVEVATELISNVALPFAKAYGGGALDDVVQRGIQKAVSKLGKTEAGKRALNAVLQMTASGAGEGFEELVAQWAEWQMPRIYGGDVESVEDNLADSLQSFIIGGMSGVAGSLVSPDTYRYKGGETSTAEEGQGTAYRGVVPQNIENPRVGRLEMSSAPYNPTGTDISTIYGNQYRNQVKENAIRRLGIADGKPAYLAAPNITKDGREYYVDVTKASLNKMLYTKGHEPLELERILLVDNLEKAIDGSYWAESKGDRKGRIQINGFDTLRTSFYIDGTPYYADIKVKVVDKGSGQNPQNVAYYIEPEEITSIKRMDTPSPTGGRHAPNIFFRDNVSIYDPSVSQNIQGVNTWDMRSGAEYARLPRLVDANGMDAAQRTAWRQALEQMPREKQMQFEMAADIARRFGAVVQARTMADGVQGSYQDGVISIATTAVDPVRQVLIHELTHHMESSGLYSRFSDAALQFVAEDMGADVDTLRRAVMADYARAGVALDEDGATREIVAKFAEEKLFTDEETVRRLLARDRNLFQRVYDWIRDTVAKLQGTREQRRLIDAQNLYERALRQAADGTQDSGAQLLYAGENARTADLDALTRAAQMEADGTDARTIRRETGWFRGMDGKWRFEIDDSGMEYRRDGDARLMEESGYRRLQELTDKWAQNAQDQGEPLTAEELAESEKLESEYYDRAWSEKYELADFLRHSDLFEAYPALRHTSVVFKETMPGIGGYYDKTMDAIVLSKDLIGSPERTLVHEIQHVIQGTEEFAGGSSPNYWKYKNKDGQGYVSDRRFVEAENRMHEAMDAMPPAVQETVRQINRAKLAQAWDEVLRLEESLYNGPYADMYSDYTQADFDRRARTDYFKNANTLELYRNTAGEIEARDAANRRGYTLEQRRQLSPDLGNEATVFADGGVGYEIKYPQYTEADIKNNSERLRSMEAVERLSGNELGDRNVPLKDRVQAFFNSLGNNIRTDRFGDVALGNSSVRSEIRHGHTPQKVMTYAAIPSVLQNGVVVYQNVKNTHELERILVAAPVEVGAEHERMYVGVMLQRDPQNQRLYLHDVVTEKEFTTGGNGHLNTTGPNAANGELFTTDILRNALNVKSRQLSTGRSIEEMAREHLSDEDIAWQEHQERVRAARKNAALDRLAAREEPPVRRGEGHSVDAELQRWREQDAPKSVEVPPVNTWGATFDNRVSAQQRSYAEAISDLVTQQVSRDAEDMRDGTGRYARAYWQPESYQASDESRLTYEQQMEEAERVAADRRYWEAQRRVTDSPWKNTDMAEQLAEASRETMRQKSAGEKLIGAVESMDGIEDSIRADRELLQMRREAREAEGMRMPETLRRLGVEPFGSEADYLGAEDLAEQVSGNERARRRIKKEVAKIPASEKEKLFARQLADGTISWEDVPQTVNRSTVDVLADYYRTMDTGTETQLLRDRRNLILEREEAKMPSLLGMDVRYDEGGLRESGKPSGRLARQVSTLRRNLQTPARVCATEWGAQHGRRVYETLFYPVTENNGRQIDWVNSMLDRVRTFRGTDGKARELNREERGLVQRLVETRAAGNRVQQQEQQYVEAKRNMDAARGITVEQYLREKGVLQEEKEQAIHAAYRVFRAKKKRGELKNTTSAAYMAETVHGYAEYEKAKDEARKELYEKVIAGEITSRSAEARIQEAINGGERAIRYFERLGVDWHKYEDVNYNQEEIFRRGTDTDSKTQEYRDAAKAWAAAKKNRPFMSAAENVRNGEAAEDAARTFGIDKSQQEYQDLQNYAAYLDAKKRVKNIAGVDAAIVDAAVKAYGTLYQELYEGINTFLTAHGYKPIGFIEGYAPHMQPETAKTAFSKALKMLGLDDTAMMLPTSISGMTADLKPYKQYDPFFQTRYGDKTEYDITKGFENYVYYLGNIFYHTDDIMRIRTAAKYIRKTYTSEEASEQISWAENARNFDDAAIEDFLRFNGIIRKGTQLGAGEARAMLNDYIDGLYEQIGDVSRYSEMVKYLDNYANRLAGKQNMLDRGAEAAAGRRSLNWVNSLLGKYGGAKLAFNVSSALNQTSQLPMVMVENGEWTTAKAIRDFFTKSRSDFVQHSNFLKGKKGVDWILGPETGWEKFKEAGFSMTEAVDSFTSYVAVRSKYLKEIRLGASDAEAIRAADEYGRNVMGSRARGEKPMLFDTKNPFWQIATRFQLEAMNSWEHITRDLPAEIRQTAKEKGKVAATGQLAGRAVRYTLAAFLINCGIGALSGGSPVPYDILGSAAEAVGAAMGMTKNQAIATMLDGVLEAVFDQRLFGTDEPEDDEEKDWWAALESLFGNAANDVPILGRAAALAGIGDQTLPTADFSKVGDLVDSARNNGILTADTLDKALTAGGEFLYGGNQLRKTVQGGMAAAQGGVYSKGKLRYQVERTPWNVGKALLFGRSALDETEEYYAEKLKTFSEKQTAAWEKMQEAGEPGKTVEEQRQRAKESYDLIRQLSGIEKENDDDNRAALQRQALRESGVSDEAKAVVWYEMMASEKDRKTMDALKDADMGEVARVLMDMKDRRKDSQKLEIIMSSSLTDAQKGTLYLETLAGDEDKEKVTALKNAGMDAYQYLTYKTAISGLSGRTEKLYAIHTLDLSDYQKDALYYLNGWSKKTHDDVPWLQGVSAEAAANRLALIVAHRESQPVEEPKWQQDLEGFLGTGTNGNPFTRARLQRETSQTNPFTRARLQANINQILYSGEQQSAAQDNPFTRARLQREAAQQTNPFLRGRG